MDISDIGYDAFLSNGNKEQTLQAKKGEVIRIRLINAAASTYFNVEFAQNPMTIIAADGIDVQPFQVQRLRIAIAETYDILVPIKDYKSYELRATAEDVTGKTSTFLGNGKKVLAPDIPKPNLFLTNHTTHHNNTSETHHHTKIMNNTKKIVKHMTDYDALQAISTTSFNTKLPKRTVILTLTGTMDGYIWSFNNKILSHADAISIEKGEIIRFILHNKTMMHHPLHLHGHFFRVITKQGARSPLKHTVNVPAMGTTTIEVEADANKHWFFHCHNLYHMHAGMARIISYKNSPRIHSKVFKKLAPNTWHIKSNLFMLSNMTAGMLQTSNAHNFFALEYDYNYKKEYDIELIYGKRLTMFFNLYAGGNFEQENKCKKSENTGIIGMQYLLPMFIESDLRINSKGKIRLSLSSAIQLTKRAMFNWYCDTDKEYRCILDYEINKKLSLTLAYDSDFTWGAGINIKL
jgi:hypothetical protein